MCLFAKRCERSHRLLKDSTLRPTTVDRPALITPVSTLVVTRARLMMAVTVSQVFDACRNTRLDRFVGRVSGGF
jgi:hypothetical protein